MLRNSVSCGSRGRRRKGGGGEGSDVHLRVEDADGRLDDADGLVVHLHRVEGILGVLEHGRQVQAQVLRVQLRHEAVRDALALAAGDLEVVAGDGQVTDDRVGRLQRHERAADEGDGHELGLIVVEGEHRLRGVVVDQLDAEDLGVGEGGRDGDLEVRRGAGVFDSFLDLLDTLGWEGVRLTSIGGLVYDAGRIGSAYLDPYLCDGGDGL